MESTCYWGPLVQTKIVLLLFSILNLFYPMNLIISLEIALLWSKNYLLLFPNIWYLHPWAFDSDHWAEIQTIHHSFTLSPSPHSQYKCDISILHTSTLLKSSVQKLQSLIDDEWAIVSSSTRFSLAFRVSAY